MRGFRFYLHLYYLPVMLSLPILGWPAAALSDDGFFDREIRLDPMAVLRDGGWMDLGAGSRGPGSVAPLPRIATPRILDGRSLKLNLAFALKLAIEQIKLQASQQHSSVDSDVERLEDVLNDYLRAEHDLVSEDALLEKVRTQFKTRAFLISDFEQLTVRLHEEFFVTKLVHFYQVGQLDVWRLDSPLSERGKVVSTPYALVDLSVIAGLNFEQSFQNLIYVHTSRDTGDLSMNQINPFQIFLGSVDFTFPGLHFWTFRVAYWRTVSDRDDDSVIISLSLPGL